MFYPTTRPSLLEKLQQGNEISWDEFYNSYAPIIRCAGKAYNFDDSLCDDLVQLVMLKFFDHARNFTYQPGKIKFRSYLASIVKTQAVDILRQQKSDRNFSDNYEPPESCFEENFMLEWRQTMLRAAQVELRRRVDAVTYQAFELYACQGRKVKEVAAVLQITPNQIYVAKNRCTKILKEIIFRCNQYDGDLHLEL
ncbi:MAG: sigma-70 family RNA polymerase sigma factor [Lentisphaerae bacterium]|nr:sigma-70 family RNA polymerase sigma factor [Lentisphaerota bacterium]